MKKKILYLIFLVSVSTLMSQNTFPTTGNVGIGTSNPTKTLDVVGQIRATSSVIAGGITSSGSNNSIWVYDRLRRPTTDSFRLTRVNGNLTATDRTYEGGFEDYNFIKFKHLTKGSSTLYLYAQNLIRLEQDVYIKEKLGIGTSTPDDELTVKGRIHAQEVKVDLAGVIAPDFVFDESYELLSLSEVEKYIRINKHLPEIPSALEMEKEGVLLKEMNLKLLQKIEELTLYTIAQEKEIQVLKQKAKSQQGLEIRLEKLEKIIAQKAQH